jgi:hypothetical protein
MRGIERDEEDVVLLNMLAFAPVRDIIYTVAWLPGTVDNIHDVK